MPEVWPNVSEPCLPSVALHHRRSCLCSPTLDSTGSESREGSQCPERERGKPVGIGRAMRIPSRYSTYSVGLRLYLLVVFLEALPGEDTPRHRVLP
jgi:hypothetical protein